ncbi:hypothetical protein [Thermoanaerobacterium thermosaccharolyticum]|uniref:hypothetical protein n=1 Tax=Thermoanaerobacterium thermosaccharolyticum TaxID=1517 RepID=UPI0020A2E874|nr:hypothetical protein [Thermoanaerobacterium thermosaccharolyticum]MCP2238872.1 hypothetical protein [Thermoanaerobacterium thermosaccharolyticum]
MKKNLSKNDIVFGTMYFLVVTLYFITAKTIWRPSAEINLFASLGFIAIATVYRYARNKGFLKRKNSLITIFLIFAIFAGVNFIGLNKVNANVFGYRGSDNVYKVVHISTYFSKSECKTLANRASRISDWTTWISVVVGSKKTVLGTLIGLYGYSVSKTAVPFQIAADRGTGVCVSYDCIIYTYTDVPGYKNISYKYY